MKLRTLVVVVSTIVGLGIAAGVLIAFALVPRTPSHDEVAERILLEFTDDPVEADAFADLADQLADDALAGNCGSVGYESWFSEAGADDAFYAWRQTCLMYFEEDLSPAQIEETKQMLVDRLGG